MIKILIIDDDTTLSQIYISVLKRNGYNVTYTQNSTEAYAKIEKNDFSIVLLDYNLTPSKELGVDLIKPLKKMMPNCKIAILTNHNEKGLEKRALNNGADIFQIKINMASADLLLALIDKLLKLPSTR